MLDKTPKKLQTEIKVALTDLYNAPGLSEATARKDQLIERYQEEATKLIKKRPTKLCNSTVQN